MALVERLMRTDPDTGRHIAVHTFFAAMVELAEGEITVAQVKGFLNTTSEDDVDLDALVALAPAGDAARSIYVNRVHSVFILAEGEITGYNTPAAVRSKLGI